MKKKIRRRLALLGAAGLCLLALTAATPRPARPAVPARPVEKAGGSLSGKIILVDAGHGGTDGGARAQESRAWEKELNLQTARAVRDALEARGATVIMTRETDMQYSENKRADLSARLALAQEGGAQMVLSIHMNEYRSRRESGPQVFYRQGQAQSRLLAGALQASLIQALAPPKQRAAMAGDYFILSLDLPSVLIECGFISNAAEERLLLDSAYQARLAQAVAQGVEDYWKMEEEND